MKCPICCIDLAIVNRQGIEIDYCPSCRGVWLDPGELEKLIERDLTRTANNSTKSRFTPQRLACMEVRGGNHSADSAFDMPGLRAWLFSRPQSNAIAGGDVYYLSSCASGRITRILLADVSGHGDSVATTATRLRDIMRQNINRIQQNRFVASMNERFSAIAEPSGKFATAIVSTYFAPTRILTMTIAGHPLPLIFRKSKLAWEILTTSEPESPGLANLPLGIDDRMHYSELSLRLDRGDRVLLYSDGLSESRDRLGKVLDTQGLRDLAETIDSSETEHFLETLLSRTLELSDHNLNHDDVTAIMIEATATPVPLMNNLLAPVRLIRSLLMPDSDPLKDTIGASGAV